MKLKDPCSLEEKLMTNLDSIFKSRDITLPAKVCLVKAMIFQIVRYECKRWTIKKAKIMASGPITSWQIDGETVTDFILGAPKSLQMVTAVMKLTDTYSLEE